MKNMKWTLVFTFALVSCLGTSVFAQYDDLYYDPDDNTSYSGSYGSSSTDDYSSDTYSYDDEYYEDDYGYDDDDSDYYDDYDYHYTSRIRRFHRPYYGFDFFDPCYIDVAYYDPFYRPGTTVLIYDDYYSYNTWNRWNRWNRWRRSGVNIYVGSGWGGFSYGPGWYDPWNGYGWNSWNRWNRWNSWNRWDNYYGGGYYGYGGYGGYGGYSNYYCPPSWGGGYVYNTSVNVSNNNNVYYGARRSGVTKVPRKGNRVIQTSTPSDVTTGRSFTESGTPELSTGGLNKPSGSGDTKIRRVESSSDIGRANPRVNTNPNSTTGRTFENAPTSSKAKPQISRDNDVIRNRMPSSTYERNTTSPSKPRANRSTTTTSPNRSTTRPAPRTYNNVNSGSSNNSNRRFDTGSSNKRSTSPSMNRSSNNRSNSRSFNNSSTRSNRSSGNLNRSNNSSNNSRSFNKSSNSRSNNSSSTRSSSGSSSSKSKLKRGGRGNEE